METAGRLGRRDQGSGLAALNVGEGVLVSGELCSHDSKDSEEYSGSFPGRWYIMV